MVEVEDGRVEMRRVGDLGERRGDGMGKDNWERHCFGIDKSRRCRYACFGQVAAAFRSARRASRWNMAVVQ